MRKTTKKILCSLLLAVLMLNVIFMPAMNVDAASLTGNTTKKLTVYSDASNTSSKLKTLKKGKKVIVLESGSDWAKVSVGGVVGYVKGKYVKTAHGTASNLYSDAISGSVSSDTLTIYSGKSGDTTALLTVNKGQAVQVLSTDSKWVKVKVGDTIGYVLGSNVKTANGTASNNSTKGEQLVAYAKRFLGNPYVYGGSSLTNGTDCSGFVMALYKHFGIKLPHSSSALRHVGKAVKGGLKNAKPGDIICYSGHVAIYMGNGKIIHASTPSTGIRITNNAHYKKILAIRRIF